MVYLSKTKRSYFILREIITKNFYQQQTERVACELLGKTLVYHKNSSVIMSGMIVEVEAYLGLKDPACHSFGGKKTPRNLNLYQDAGYTYVYLIYGIYHCMNFVTGNTQTPEAVLIRAIEPQKGLSIMKKNRKIPKKAQSISLTAGGPGRLCQAFGFNLTHNQWDLQNTSPPAIYVLNAPLLKASQICQTTRIGIQSSGDAAFWPLRFYIKDHPCVSVP